MFDPYDQVQDRTQRLLASASRIREEQALKTAARARQSDVMATAPPSQAGSSPVTAVDSAAAVACPPDAIRAETPAKSGSARTRAA